MDAALAWRTLFENWPDNIPREGIVVSITGETVVFINFLISGGLLLLERDRPDLTGARKAMIPYSGISTVKFTTTMELAQFQVMGFQRPL